MVLRAAFRRKDRRLRRNQPGGRANDGKNQLGYPASRVSGPIAGNPVARIPDRKARVARRHPEDHGQNLATGFRILPGAGLRAQGGEKGLLGRGIRPVCHGVRRLEMTVADVRFLMFRLAVSLKLCSAFFLCGRELAVALGPRYAAAVAGTFGNTTRRFVRRRPCEYIYERIFLSGPGPENERIEGFRFAARPRSFFSSTVASC